MARTLLSVAVLCAVLAASVANEAPPYYAPTVNGR